jgi:hypothetical protein
MDDETMKTLQILRDVNEALIVGLEGAISCMENWKNLSQEVQQSTIDKLKAIVAQSGKYYGTKQSEH